MNFFFVVNYDSIRSLRVQVVVKNILLHNSTHSLISAVWKSSFIMHIHDLADMGIYGKSIHMMQCKQADTLCYLFSNATEFHQFFLCLMVTHIIDFSREISPDAIVLAVTAIYFARYPRPQSLKFSSVA